MTFTLATFITSIILNAHVESHMLLHTPPARWSKFNPEYVKAGKVDENLHSPLGGPLGTRLPFPCGRAKGPAGTTLKAGQSVKWSLYGGATHNGGHCEISLSYDDKTFVSIQTIVGNCMKYGKLDYEVTIPANAPSGPATFAWTWVNWSGNREYYMNCADVNIEGNPNGVLTGPKIVEANMPGRPTIPEFQSPKTGAQLYENRPIVSVTSKGETGNVGAHPKPQQPQYSTTTVPSKPKPSSEKPPSNKNPGDKPSASNPPINRPQPNLEPTKPNNLQPTQSSEIGKCEHGKWECNGKDYHVCVWGAWEQRRCPSTTKCYQVTDFNILCLN